MKLFGDLGRPEDKVKVSVAGCSDKSVDLSRTSLKDTGVALTTVSLGTCEGTGKLTATTGNSPPATVFRSPATGLGVISDIDDTIKITDVLNDKVCFRSFNSIPSLTTSSGTLSLIRPWRRTHCSTIHSPCQGCLISMHPLQRH